MTPSAIRRAKLFTFATKIQRRHLDADASADSRERTSYLIRHGQGYTVFEHASHGISQELLLFAPLDAPVKISLLRLRNRTESQTAADDHELRRSGARVSIGRSPALAHRDGY